MKNKIDRKDINNFLLTAGLDEMADVVNGLIKYHETNSYPILIIGERSTGKKFASKILLDDCALLDNMQIYCRDCRSYSPELLQSELYDVCQNANYSGIYLSSVLESSIQVQNCILSFLKSIPSNDFIFADKKSNNRVIPIVLTTSVDIKLINKALSIYSAKPDDCSDIFNNSFDRAEKDNAKKILVDVGGMKIPIIAELNRSKTVGEQEKNADHHVRFELSYDLLLYIYGKRLEVPPLRDRIIDLPKIARYLIEKNSRKLGIDITGIDGLTILFILNNPWYGNYRELEDYIYTGILNNSNGVISFDSCFKYYGMDRFVDTVLDDAYTIDRPIHGDFVDMYLGIRPSTEDSSTTLSTIFELNNIEDICFNLFHLNRIEYRREKSKWTFDYEKAKQYLELLLDDSIKPNGIYKLLDFESSKEFEEWRKRNHLGIPQEISSNIIDDWHDAVRELGIVFEEPEEIELREISANKKHDRKKPVMVCRPIYGQIEIDGVRENYNNKVIKATEFMLLMHKGKSGNPGLPYFDRTELCAYINEDKSTKIKDIFKTAKRFWPHDPEKRLIKHYKNKHNKNIKNLYYLDVDIKNSNVDR